MKLARTTRASLLLSAAGFGLCAIAAPALANDESPALPRLDISGSSLDPHSARPTDVIDIAHSESVKNQAQTGFVSPDEAVDSPDITINNNFNTTTNVYDPTNITGVGQLITDAGGGFIGTCTATLINPRTIIFAAHCVNTRAATAYGANSGGVGAGIGFETNTRANAAGQTDELVRWLLGGTGGAGQFQSNTQQHFYNLSQVFWNPASTAPASCTSPTSCFLEADVATAVLDTPAAGVPTWALLFSPLPTPTSISTTAGTSYHVAITGYGAYGNGTTGAATNGNFRRRAAENMLGALVSLDTRGVFLFGSGSGRPQQLYFLDFDDPARGTATANPRDFNGFRDNALPREGLTGPGDSGGPLILDQAFSKQVVIGVLSGGSTFYSGQQGGSYGTQSFYQPLFLYWDWIVANNPYRYVTAVAGNRNWEDGAAWVTELDPNYQIITGGQLVNGVPTHTGAANSGNGPQFGEMCFQSPNSSTNPAVNECENIATGAIRNNVPNGSVDESAPALASITGELGLIAGLESPEAAPGYTDTVRPAPTLANGLPGATGFTPNNVDGVRTTGTMGRYYDVTLRNAGVITLNSAVTIDRFSIMGATSQLTIASGASLRSLMEIRQNTGTILNNGTLTSAGDYLILSGLLTGSGTVNAPFTTSVLGSFAPGTIGTTGTMTFNGGLVMSSGSSYLVDLGASGTSDRIVVQGANGVANLGGSLQLAYNAATLRAGNSYTILTATGGVSGTFAAPTAISAILRPTVTYSTNAVTLNVVAGSYTNVVPSSNAVGYAWARLLDANRSQASRFDSLYGPLDLQNAATIVGTLSGWAPAAETTALTLGLASTDSTSTFIRNRLAGLDPQNMGGSMAYYGSPVQVAALGLSPMGANPVRSDMPPPMVQEGALPETMSGFISGGYLKGDGAAMAGMGGRDNYDGWYVGAGLEVAIDDTGLIGFAFTYTDTDGTASFGAQKARGEAFQGTLYAKQRMGGVTLDGQVTAGALGTTTERTAAFLGTNYTLRAKDSAMIVGGEVGLGFDLGTDAIEIAPRVAARGTWIDFGSAQESGGPMALDIGRADYNSVQGRAGLTVAGKSDGLRPFVTGTYVHEFKDRATFVAASLAGGFWTVPFALNSQDKDWGEVSGGITFRTGSTDFSLAADTTIGRSDLSAQTYRGSVTFRF